MQWFYAIDGERRGPVSPEELARLIAHGTVTDGTLVWREGFAAWEPWSRVAEANPLPAIDASVPPPVIERSADPVATDAERAWSFDEFSRRLEQTGVATSVGGCLSRAWGNYKANFGLALGAILVAMVIMVMVGSLVEMVTGGLVDEKLMQGQMIDEMAGALVLAVLAEVFLKLFLVPHLMAGCSWLFVARARGEPTEFTAIFEGFKRCYGKLIQARLIQIGLNLGFIGVIAACMMVMGISPSVLHLLAMGAPEVVGTPGMLTLAQLTTFLVIMATLAVLYFWLRIRFVFALLIALDRPVQPLEAFKLSWCITRGRLGTLLGLAIILVLLAIAGILALLIGLIFVIPVLFAVVAQYYHDACESAASRPPE